MKPNISSHLNFGYKPRDYIVLPLLRPIGIDSTPRQIEFRGDDTVDPGSDPRVDRPTLGDSNLPDEFGGTKSRKRLAFF